MILVVDDDRDVQDMVCYNLEQSDFRPLSAENGEDALQCIQKDIPDLVVLDLMLPDMDGFDVCRSLKNNPMTNEIPVIMLTAKGEETDIVSGLELGAVDYVVKPFSPRVLLARIRTALRERGESFTENPKRLQLDDLTLDPETREVWIGANTVSLTYTEFELLHFLLRHPGKVHSRAQLIEAVQGDDYPVTGRSIDVQIVGLRKKLHHMSERVETVRGIGYRLRR